MSSLFVKLAVDRFGFLERDFGFSRITVDALFVRWQTDDVFVQVHFDAKRSHEIDAEIGQLHVLFNGKERPFNLGEVARMSGNSWSQFRVLNGRDEGALIRALEEFADLLEHQGQALLRNEAVAFEVLGRQREQECVAYAIERDVAQMKATADKAWHDHDYRTIVELYGQHKSSLSSVEVKRYEIALKRLANE